MNENKLKELMQRYENDLTKLVSDAYISGYNDGVGVKLPTKEEFDEHHKQVRDYGDEAEWLVLSANLYDESEARELFKKYCLKEFGNDAEQADNIVDTISIRWIGYKVGPYESEPTYWLSNDGVSGRWQAWIVETQ